VAGGRLRERVILMTVSEDGAIYTKPAQTAFIIGSKTIQVVCPHLIDSDHDDEAWRLGPDAARCEQHYQTKQRPKQPDDDRHYFFLYAH
jgi:hypothetical protein